MAVTYTTWNPSDKATNITLSDGNLSATKNNTGWGGVRSVLGVSTGKWYWEHTVINHIGYQRIGIGTSAVNINHYPGVSAHGYGYRNTDGKKAHCDSAVAYGDTFDQDGDIISIALDMDAGKIWWAKNGVWQAGGDPVAGTGEAYSSISGTFFAMCAGYTTGTQITVNFGASAFSHSVPSGFNAGLYEGGDEEITFPNPLSATASLQSNVQVEFVPGILSAESSISIGEPFWGSYAELPSPFFAEGSLQAKTGIDIAITPFASQSNLQSNIQIELVPSVLTSQSALSISEIWCGIITTLPNPFSANASLHASTQIEIVTSPLIATSELFSNIGIEVSAGALNATGAILATPVYPIILTGAKRIYLFTLTGAADGVADIIIPISSFQSRIKSGDPTYLSVVIPGTEYVSAINERLNGDLVVRMGYQDGDEILLTEIISKVLFENITIYEGATNKSIILDGHKTETWTPKTVSLENASYYNLTKGKLRYRCKPDLYLRPGDIANINDNSFTVESITYSVSPMLETYEIAE